MEILVLTLSIVSILCLLLFLYEHKSRLRDQEKSRINPFISTEHLSEDVNNILHKAVIQSETIIAKAEDQALEVVAKGKLTGEKFNQEYDGQFKAVLTESEAYYKKRMEELEKTYAEFIKQVQNTALESNKSRDQIFTEQIQNLSHRLEENVFRFLDETQKKSIQQVQMELNAARQLLDNYKASQMRLVDENIIAVLERTLALVLNRNISLDEQVDLVFEALDRAKKEKFFI